MVIKSVTSFIGVPLVNLQHEIFYQFHDIIKERVIILFFYLQFEKKINLSYFIFFQLNSKFFARRVSFYFLQFFPDYFKIRTDRASKIFVGALSSTSNELITKNDKFLGLFNFTFELLICKISWLELRVTNKMSLHTLS